MRKFRVLNLTKETEVAEMADLADDSKSRRIGLLSRECFESGEGLWIVPCEAVHTFGMRFPIDVVFLNRKLRVVKVRKAMGRRRLSGSIFAHSVLELPAGTTDQTRTEPGDQLRFDKLDGARNGGE